MRGDGDGWTECAAGHPHWGVHGAAGLLLRAPDGRLLLQHRAERSHHGGTWGVPGGARDSGESAVVAALREAGEETDLDGATARIDGVLRDDHGGWSYTTVLGSVPAPEPVLPGNWESTELRWVTTAQLTELPLHPGLAAAGPLLVTWPTPGALPRRLVLLVDAANVVGSRPDGWWRDRLGAAARLRASLEVLATGGIDGADVGSACAPLVGSDGQARDVHVAGDVRRWSIRWFPEVVLVVEGAARPLADDETGSVRARAAAGSGDDEIVAAVQDCVRRAPTDLILCVTADRELSRRCVDAGAQVVGPGWLWRLLDACPDPS